MSGALARWLQRQWWQPRRTIGSYALAPLAALLGGWARRRAARALPWRAPCPVVVVGNLVVGGAGKTPTVIALVDALRRAGWRPGVVSRGYGRRSNGSVVASAGATAADLGDEPWLIARRSGAPVAVDADRPRAVRALLQAHPEVNLVIADDGLQHRALARDVAVWVFDDRGIGNGATLPAGPLREPLPAAVPPGVLVLYNALRQSTPLPGAVARRRLSGAVSLVDWHRGEPMQPGTLTALRGRKLLAVAGIGEPERFFGMLEDAGLRIERAPHPDHAEYTTLPWHAATADVVCTEKDAAKLGPAASATTRVWVVGLDFRLPDDFVADLAARLRSTIR